MKKRPVVIAHRGASGYLPEHTLAAKALAVGMGADFLEQDVVASRDGHLIVLHDLTLEHTTDVRERFAGRARADGSFYCIDFDLAELRTLTLGERLAKAGSGPRYPGRFPEGAGRFPIVTLEEELRFVEGLNRSTGRRIGIYPEIKEPAWHRAAGIEVGDRMLDLLAAFGYRGADDAVFVQCFDAVELQRLRRDRSCRLRLVQLIEGGGMVPSATDLARIAGYADAIGAAVRLICQGRSGGMIQTSSLVADAHAAGLAVHPYTLRKDDLPEGIAGLDELLELLLVRLGADGAFTDFPDIAAQFIRRHFPA